MLLKKFKASIPGLLANSNGIDNIQHLYVFTAVMVLLKKPQSGPEGLIGPPCHGDKELIMKRILMILFIIIIWLCLFTSCSTTYLKQSFKDYSKSTKTIGKNTVDCFEQLFEEEINTRIAESSLQETMKQELLEPHVFTWNHLEIRVELINYIINYVKLLESVVVVDYQKEIKKNAKKIEDNLETISTYHDFLQEKEIAILTSSSTGLAEVLTDSARRSFLIRTMTSHQPLLEMAVHRLIKELLTAKELINNFYQRQFLHQVKFPWPSKETSREKYAKIGVKILKRKRKINSQLRDVIKALDMIPLTHKELIGLLKKDDTPLRTLDQLTNLGARLEEMSWNRGTKIMKKNTKRGALFEKTAPLSPWQKLFILRWSLCY